MASWYSNSQLDSPDFQVMRDFARRSLSESLQRVEGQKELVLQVDMMKALDRVFGAVFLKELEISKIYKLDEVPPPSCRHRLFIVEADVNIVKQIANLVNGDKAANISCNYRLFLVPRKLQVCEQVLEREGVYGYVMVEDLNLGLIPLEDDILSLEMPKFFKSFYLDNDLSGIYGVAAAIVDVQSLFGAIPFVYGQGKAAKMAFELATLLSEEKHSATAALTEISHLFLFDRDVDYVSVLLTQLTYEGLLDETFGINCGYIDFGREVIDSQENVRMLLNNQDEIFKEIRNKHFSKVFKFLSVKAKELQAGSQQRQNMSLGEMKNFVSKELKDVKQQHRSLAVFIGACEVIMKQKSDDFEEHLQTESNLIEGSEFQESVKYIEEVINRQFPVAIPLRLLCLLSCTNDGLPTREYRALKRQFLQSYGYEHLITFQGLQKLGLYLEQESAVKIAGKVAAAVTALPRRKPFQVITKKLNLIPKRDDNYNLDNPTDMGYIYSGVYSPLICNLINQILKKSGVEGLEDIVKYLPGPSFSYSRPKSARDARPSDRPPKHVVLVFFLGGVTYAEVAALRLLGKLQGIKFIIATTAVINGNSLMDSVLGDVTKLNSN